MAADSGFAGRLAYVRWLRARGRVAPETDREFAAALGVTYGWLAKWKIRPDAPDGRTETRALEQALAPMGVTGDWLFDDIADPPEPELWRVWSAGTKRTAKRVAEEIPMPAVTPELRPATEAEALRLEEKIHGRSAQKKASSGRRRPS